MTNESNTSIQRETLNLKRQTHLFLTGFILQLFTTEEQKLGLRPR
jgi:hypothetical protein